MSTPTFFPIIGALDHNSCAVIKSCDKITDVYVHDSGADEDALTSDSYFVDCAFVFDGRVRANLRVNDLNLAQVGAIMYATDGGRAQLLAMATLRLKLGERMTELTRAKEEVST